MFSECQFNFLDNVKVTWLKGVLKTQLAIYDKFGVIYERGIIHDVIILSLKVVGE